jgi:hypothetical protein
LSLLDKLLGLDLVEDLTETTWWTDNVFRGLEKADLDEQDAGPADSVASAQRSAGPE